MFSFLNKHSLPVPVSEADFHQIEEEFQITLPPLLKDFYRNYNGLSMRSVLFHVDGHEYAVERFFAVGAGSMSADRIMEIYRLCRYVPDGYFPLALSYDGDEFFVDTRNDGVYYVSLDNHRKYIPIVPTLEDFFDLLETECKKSAGQTS